MTGLLLAVVSLLYFLVSLSYLKAGNIGMCMAFLFYALANVGLFIAGRA